MINLYTTDLIEFTTQTEFITLFKYYPISHPHPIPLYPSQALIRSPTTHLSISSLNINQCTLKLSIIMFPKIHDTFHGQNYRLSYTHLNHTHHLHSTPPNPLPTVSMKPPQMHLNFPSITFKRHAWLYLTTLLEHSPPNHWNLQNPIPFFPKHSCFFFSF